MNETFVNELKKSYREKKKKYPCLKTIGFMKICLMFPTDKVTSKINRKKMVRAILEIPQP